MARGVSGRIVIEVEPDAKRRLYAALALSGSTLKQWFLKAAADYCAEAAQPSLFIGKNLKLVNKRRKGSGSNVPHKDFVK